MVNKMFKNLDFADKAFIFIVVIFFIVGGTTAVYKQEKISKANIEIETSDNIYYTLKETLMISPDNSCIDFYDLVEEYNTKHCGHYTVRYLK